MLCLVNNDDRKRIGLEVASARTRRGWGKEKAAREANVSSITWKKVEDGMPVQDASLAVVLAAVGFELAGDVLVPKVQPSTVVPAAPEDLATRVARLEQRVSELERRTQEVKP